MIKMKKILISQEPHTNYNGYQRDERTIKTKMEHKGRKTENKKKRSRTHQRPQ